MYTVIVPLNKKGRQKEWLVLKKCVEN